MARTKFPVEVLTPEGKVFEDEVEMVSTRTTTGSIGVLANHAPLMAILEPTELRLHQEGDEVTSFAQAEGYLQVIENSALVLVEEAVERGRELAGQEAEETDADEPEAEAEAEAPAEPEPEPVPA